jgi:hypothetical protein
MPPNAVQSSGMSTPHSHCGRANAAGSAIKPKHRFEATFNCAGAPCAQAQTLSSPVNGRDDAQTAGVLATVGSVSTVTSKSRFGFAPYERSLAKLLPLDPISISLRI